MAVPEAMLKTTDAGLELGSEGWFVLSLADARWLGHEQGGTFCPFDSDKARFADFGINVHLLEPGQPNAKYHSESAQEGFLVLAGECLLLIEEEERRLGAWDYVHCPAGTRHVLVGAGDGPCAILMVGARQPDATVHYPASELAIRHGAAAPHETDSQAEAYADWSSEFTPRRMRWPLA